MVAFSNGNDMVKSFRIGQSNAAKNLHLFFNNKKKGGNIVIILYQNDDLKEKGIPYSENTIITWKCGKCGKIHQDTGKNLRRRKFLCSCYKLEEQINKIENKLNKIGYTFLSDQPDAYSLGQGQKEINTQKPILVKCLNCGKVSKEYLNNLLSKHKKCNCDPSKCYTNNLTKEEFIDKWTDFNKKHWELLDNEYKNRNTKYQVKCIECGNIEYRWGISLLDHDLSCRNCSNISIGEKKIKDYLDKQKILYKREYAITLPNKEIRFFDFFLPDKNVFIEFNGIQHYEAIEYFGGIDRLKAQQKRDESKIQWCKDNNYKLLIIRYDEDVESKLNEFFNK